MNEEQKQSKKITPKQYTKKQFVESSQYTAMDRDILKILLKENQKYTKDDVEKVLKEFKEKKVK